MKQVPVKVSASFPHGNSGRRFRFVVEDASSGVVIVDVEMPVETVGLFLSSMGHLDATAAVFDAYDRIGKVAERKSVRVPCTDRPWGDDSKAQAWRAAIAARMIPFEVDGWRAQIPSPGSLSQGQITGSGEDQTISVQLVRYVEAALHV